MRNYYSQKLLHSQCNNRVIRCNELTTLNVKFITSLHCYYTNSNIDVITKNGCNSMISKVLLKVITSLHHFLHHYMKRQGYLSILYYIIYYYIYYIIE